MKRNSAVRSRNEMRRWTLVIINSARRAVWKSNAKPSEAERGFLGLNSLMTSNTI